MTSSGHSQSPRALEEAREPLREELQGPIGGFWRGGASGRRSGGGGIPGPVRKAWFTITYRLTPQRMGRVEVQVRLGGLLNYYHRRAA